MYSQFAHLITSKNALYANTQPSFSHPMKTDMRDDMLQELTKEQTSKGKSDTSIRPPVDTSNPADYARVLQLNLPSMYGRLKLFLSASMQNYT